MGELGTALSAGTTSYAIAPNLRALAADDMQYAYRDVGEPVGRALVCCSTFGETSTAGIRAS
jgi:hypothetical protein